MQENSDALCWKGRVISRELLGQYVHSTMRRLKEFGLTPSSQVVISAAISPSYVIVLLSLWALGIAPFLVKKNALVQLTSGGFRPSLVLVDQKEGSLRREMLLGDMVTLEIVEAFLGASRVGDLSPDPAARAAVLFSSAGTEEALSFSDLCSLAAHETIPCEALLSVALDEPQGLSAFYKAVKAGATVII